MNSNQRFKINIPDIIHETIDNEVLIIEFNSGNYYSLKEVGAEIWAGLVKGANSCEIISEISKKYTGSQEDIIRCVTQLIGELIQEKIITPVPTNQTQDLNQIGKVDFADKVENPAFSCPELQKYTDMQELLLLDPIHEVTESGWPSMKPDSANN